ncbi:hypothetical protein GTW59_18080 [Streptomyces sp. SID89]|nr:hypothetical protein [Streptomyces sp. SID89]
MTEAKALNDWPQPYRLMAAEPYWQALSEEQLTFQRCADCARAVWPVHTYCTHCGSAGLSWERSGGHGTVYSYSTILRGPTPVWAGIAPYTVGFVEMDEGYFLFTQIEGDPDDIEIGKEVTVRYVQRGEQKLPVFTMTGNG